MKVISRKERLDALGAAALFVSHDRPEAVRAIMLRELDCPYPVAVDPEKTAYRAWGLRRLPLALIVLDPKVWRQYATLLASGERMRHSGGDLRQMGGDFVVDAAGAIAYARPQRRDDRPPVGELLAAIEEVA